MSLSAKVSFLRRFDGGTPADVGAAAPAAEGGGSDELEAAAASWARVRTPPLVKVDEGVGARPGGSA